MSDSLSFPADFVWGAAAAAPQIEGAAFEDGKGTSIWDTFSRIEGKTVNGDTLDVACDHYHRFEEDASLMADLGITHYRLSVAWPRIFPQGTGDINQAGLDFYDRLIDCFLRHGITPWITLFHWDLPQALEDRDGWLNRDTVDAYAPYTEVVTKRFGDRVRHWFTLNEMPCFIGLSYETGIHAPGRKEPMKKVNQGYHHALLCHGRAVDIVRANVPNSHVGIVHVTSNPIPVIETPEHIEAARAAHLRLNGHLMGPIFQGAYPDWLLESPDCPDIREGDLEAIHRPGDFLGLNIYSGYFVHADRPDAMPLPHQVPFPRGFPQGDLPWINIVPQAPYWAARFCRENFGAQSFYITEHGSACDDDFADDGEIYDLDRREIMRNYLSNMHRAIQEGLDYRGYFAWSVMDNFEWAEGYIKRFGIVHVDFETQKRTPKLSARWYSHVIRENRLV